MTLTTTGRVVCTATHSISRENISWETLHPAYLRSETPTTVRFRTSLSPGKRQWIHCLGTSLQRNHTETVYYSSGMFYVAGRLEMEKPDRVEGPWEVTLEERTFYHMDLRIHSGKSMLVDHPIQTPPISGLFVCQLVSFPIRIGIGQQTPSKTKTEIWMNGTLPISFKVDVISGTLNRMTSRIHTIYITN